MQWPFRDDDDDDFIYDSDDDDDDDDMHDDDAEVDHDDCQTRPLKGLECPRVLQVLALIECWHIVNSNCTIKAYLPHLSLIIIIIIIITTIVIIIPSEMVKMVV